jgi:hypothetical protein
MSARHLAGENLYPGGSELEIACNQFEKTILVDQKDVTVLQCFGIAVIVPGKEARFREGAAGAGYFQSDLLAGSGSPVDADCTAQHRIKSL